MSINKDLVRNFVERVWNENNSEFAENYVSPNYVIHLLGANKDNHGIEFVKTNVSSTHLKFSNLHIEILDMIEEGDKVVMRIIITSTKNQVQISSREIMIIRILDGKIVEGWSLGSQWD
jgi:predicted SnoaL-like aldol condensation-catalyzing enzyme